MKVVPPAPPVPPLVELRPSNPRKPVHALHASSPSGPCRPLLNTEMPPMPSCDAGLMVIGDANRPALMVIGTPASFTSLTPQPAGGWLLIGSVKVCTFSVVIGATVRTPFD